MPKRTNSFQKLILLLLYEKLGDRVKESEFLVSSMGISREVDVVIREVVGGHTVIISIECIDHNRPADIEWIDKMDSKHSDLPTDKLVLVSEKGFTKNALLKAEKLNYETISLDNSQELDWAIIAQKLKYIDLYSVEFTVVSTKLHLVDKDGNQLTKSNASQNVQLFDEKLIFKMNLLELVRLANKDVRLPTNLLRLPNEQFEFPVDIILEEEIYIKQRDEEIPYKVTKVEVFYKFDKKKYTVALEHGLLKNKAVSFGSTNVGDGEATVAIIEEENAEIEFRLVLPSGRILKGINNSPV